MRRRTSTVDTVQDLIILTYADYLRVRRELKAAGLDLCYTAQIEQPVRLDWSPDLLRDPEFLRQLTQRRPTDASFRIAAVRLIKKGNWFRPDQYAITFHAVGATYDAELQRYLTEHDVHSSTDVARAMLTAS
jgi:hypothetical protein